MAIIAKNTNLRLAGVNPLAIAMGAKLNDAFFSEADTALEALNHTRVMSIFMASHVNEIFTHEEIVQWPIVDTNKKADEGYEGNNPDYTVVMDGKKTSRVSFFDTMIDRSKWAVVVLSQLEAVNDAISQKTGYNQKLASNGPAWLDAEKKRLTQRLKDVKNMFRKAVKIVQQRALLTELIGDDVIKFEYWTNAQGEVIPSSTPIVLTLVSKSALFDIQGIGTFLGLDIPKAVDMATDDTPQAVWDALMLTKSKGADDEEEADPDNLEVNNNKRFETAAASMLYWLRKDKTISQLYAGIDKAKEIGEVADQLLTISGLAAELADMAEHFSAKIDKARDYMKEVEKKVA